MYFSRSVILTVKHPSILLSLVASKNIGVELHRRRTSQWVKISEKYRDTPKEVNGFQIFLNPEDKSLVSASIGVDGMLDLPLSCLMSKILKKGMYFVDVGANLGYYTLLASKLVKSEGKVYAFEPDAANFQFLSRSLRYSYFRNAEIFNQAISDRIGKVSFFKTRSDEPNARSISTDRGLGVEEVSCTTLDEFWRVTGHLSWNMVKIHVLGDDPLILRGGSHVLKNVRPMIVMIYYPPKWTQNQDLLKTLFDMYNVHEIIESPFLIRKVSLKSLSQNEPTHLFLTPSPNF